MNSKFEINDLSDIMNINDNSSFNETFNDINLALDDNITIQENNNKIELKTFEEVLKDTKNKFKKLTKNKDIFKAPYTFIDKIKKDNIHLQYIFKDKNINFDNIYNIPEVLEFKNNLKNKEEIKSSIIDFSKEDTKDTKTFDKIFYKNNQNNKNEFSNIYTKLNIKKDFPNNDDKIYNSEKLENMTEFVGINSNFENNEYNFGSNVKIKEKSNINLIGKKRNNEEKNISKKNKESIFNEINELYNQYNKNYKKKCVNNSIYKIYEDTNFFFKINFTIIEKNIPICVIYFDHKLIKKIFLIREEILIENENDILEVLDIIKNNISNECEKNLIK